MSEPRGGEGRSRAWLLAGNAALAVVYFGIALSGYGMEDDVRRSREAGFAKHLKKPVNLPLEAAIRQALRDEVEKR